MKIGERTLLNNVKSAFQSNPKNYGNSMGFHAVVTKWKKENDSSASFPGLSAKRMTPN